MVYSTLYWGVAAVQVQVVAVLVMINTAAIVTCRGPQGGGDGGCPENCTEDGGGGRVEGGPGGGD